MVQLQIISKILATKSISILEDNDISPDYFVGYENEIGFINNHIKEFGNVPDTATFLAKFPDIELVEVEESDKYLVNTIREEHLYYNAVPLLQKMAELLKTDANAAVEFLRQSLPTLNPSYDLGGTNIIQQADERLEHFKEIKNKQDDYFFTTGFEELDETIHGLQRGEELLVLVARINQGKSWILAKMCTHIWQLGYNVGYISPEMSAMSIGYRFDTLYKHFSNKSLMWGNNDITDEDYEAYTNELKNKKNKFIVATPLDFNKKITITKLKQWVTQHKLDMIAIDGITYLSDERYQRGDNKTTTLTNISEDLMGLSIELGIPIVVVVQANRSGVVDGNTEGTPELEHIKDSDGIGANASKVIAIKQSSNGLELGIKKNRFGNVGGKLLYSWDINNGNFEYIPSYDDTTSAEHKQRKVAEVKKKFNDVSDVF